MCTRCTVVALLTDVQWSLQSAAMYAAPQVSMAAPAQQQYAPQPEAPYATDAYQAVMGSSPQMQVTHFSKVNNARH